MVLTKATDEPKRAKKEKEKCKEHVPVAGRSHKGSKHTHTHDTHICVCIVYCACKGCVCVSGHINHTKEFYKMQLNSLPKREIHSKLV